MDKSTLDILKESEDKEVWIRLYEKTKLYIATTSLMSTTKEGIQRRNNWIECLNYLQNMLKDKEIKDKNMDFLTMKKK